MSLLVLFFENRLNLLLSQCVKASKRMTMTRRGLVKKIIMGVVAVLLGVIGFAVISQQPVQASQKQSSNQNSDDKK